MKKKTIKFYFFNPTQNKKNPATNGAFCFSKRALRQNNLVNNYKFNVRGPSKKKNERLREIKFYKSLIKGKIKIHI